MRLGHVFTVGVALLLSLPLVAQEPQPSKSCIAPGETIYKPGVDGVNPPQPKPDKNAKNAPKIQGAISLELVVNGKGSVCSVRVLAATDKSSAQDTADYISKNWSFKPATKKGKPVAVAFTMNFRPN
ncbi:MAG: TonB family protein [Terriglobia bacterium]|nr:TonB family protein [Terriglobia bacterium]